MASPDVSVVIPTHGREARLAFALEALAEQSIGAERLEVIVVRDAGAPGPLAEPPPQLDCRYLSLEGGGGPSAKRELGWRSARAPLIAFCDDDCRATPGWLEALLAAWNGEPSVVLQGRTEVEPGEAHLQFGLARTTVVSGPSPWFETCNIAYPRELLELVGGFDEEFTFGGEDSDLGQRALAAGAEHRFVADALNYHAVVAPPFWQAIRSADRFTSQPLLYRRYPHLRRHIYLRVFRNPAHAMVLLALAGLAAAPLSGWWTALAAAPYVATATVLGARRSPRQLVRLATQLPIRFARDLVEVSGTVRGAVRYRVLML